jgi:hypothetical protein
VNAIPLKGDQRLSRLSRPVPAFSGGGAITGETIPPVSFCVNWGLPSKKSSYGGHHDPYSHGSRRSAW